MVEEKTVVMDVREVRRLRRQSVGVSRRLVALGAAASFCVLLPLLLPRSADHGIPALPASEPFRAPVVTLTVPEAGLPRPAVEPEALDFERVPAPRRAKKRAPSPTVSPGSGLEEPWPSGRGRSFILAPRGPEHPKAWIR